MLLLALLLSQAEPDPEPPRYRNPTGSLQVGGILGAAVGGGGSAFVFGASVGYAVITGVVPGVRAFVIAGDELGGQASGTLTLTPPLDWPVLPFVIGEAGHRWDRGASGWIYGGGGGLYIGAPQNRFAVQVGWIFRRWAIKNQRNVDASGPLIGLAASF